MKKAYVAPSIIRNGTAVRETLSGTPPSVETDTTFGMNLGIVGFYL